MINRCFCPQAISNPRRALVTHLVNASSDGTGTRTLTWCRKGRNISARSKAEFWRNLEVYFSASSLMLIDGDLSWRSQSGIYPLLINDFVKVDVVYDKTYILTHWGLVAPYSFVNVGQFWTSHLPDAWRHHFIAWSNVDSSCVWLFLFVFLSNVICWK